MKIITTKDLLEAIEFYAKLNQVVYGDSSKKATINQEFFDTAFFISKNDEIITGAVLYKNPHLSFEQQNASCFGNFETINDLPAVKVLFHEIESTISEKSFLIGPMNGSTWDQYRLNDNPDSNLFLSEFSHPNYYSDLLQQSHFETIATYQSKIDYEIPTGQAEILALKSKLLEKGVVFRNIKLAEYEKELEKLFPFITKAFESNYLYTPISWGTFFQKYSEVKSIIQEDYVLLAEFEDELIGFMFCFPNLLNPTEKQLIVKTIARDKNPAWRGLGHVMGDFVLEKAKNSGFKAIIHAFMYDEGTSQGVSNDYLGKAYKSYSLFGKKL